VEVVSRGVGLERVGRLCISIDVDNNLATVSLNIGDYEVSWKMNIFSSNEFYVKGDSETSIYIVKKNNKYTWTIKRNRDGEVIDEVEIPKSEVEEIVLKTLVEDYKALLEEMLSEVVKQVFSA
jgi:sortase (surface protein transpeptidase)